MTLNRATVTESMVSAGLLVAIAVPTMIVADLEPIYAAGVALVVATLLNATYWTLRGESPLYGIKRRTEYEWESDTGGTSDR